MVQTFQCIRPVLNDLEKPKGIWFLESGCTIHMPFDETAFEELKPFTSRVEVMVDNNAVLETIAEGNVPLRTTTRTAVILENVLLVPELAANLISFTRIMEKECANHKSRRGVYVFDSWNELLLTGTESKGMLKINVQQGCHIEPLLRKHVELKLEREQEVNKDDATASTTAWPTNHIYRHVKVLYAGVSDPRSKASLSTWHKRLGHGNNDYVRRTAGATEGMIIAI